MAVPQNTLIGKTKQSVGNATFTTWKGINVLKSKPVSVANPRTQGQVNQRTMMANFVKLYRENAAIFNAGFRQLAVKQSAYNAASSANLKNASINNQDSPVLADPSILEVAKGSLYPAPITGVVTDRSSNAIVINWSPGIQADQLNGDIAYATAYSNDGTVVGSSIGEGVRSDGELTFDLAAGVNAGIQINVYLFFVQTGSGKVWDSDHVFSTIIA